jgi:transposase-like protein
LAVAGDTCTGHVDQNGKSVDCFLRQRRDVGAAQTFFRRALQKQGDPLSITLNAYAAWHRAVQEWKESGEILYQKMGVRSCASLHPVVEPDHRGVKRRVNPMLGFQSFEKARVVIASIELAQKMGVGDQPNGKPCGSWKSGFG